ncbi:hypothetical protein J2Z70_002167 [Paenibacillus silagei]|uniref:Uncharacterized protein n=1 Tax=Paenibacillus silagei TaxID=1670801 RepID=A0ABS4NPL5_9BACL|nr:hypothetical protein [Paenibacillus silagei]
MWIRPFPFIPHLKKMGEFCQLRVKFTHSFYDHLQRVEHKKESYIEKFRYTLIQ